MADIRRGRWTAHIEGDFVVFIIGARINSKLQALRVLADLGGRRGMNHMLKHLMDHPDKGLLAYETCGFTIIQYWRSFEQLEAFAKNTDDPHLEAWRTYWRRVGTSTRAGICTRRTWCDRGSTRRSTATCRRMGWRRRAA